MKISIIVDNPASWFNQYLGKLAKVIKKYDPNYSFAKSVKDLKNRDILFILSCDKVLKRKTLALHKHNIVIHNSDLPRGRGWSPITWQVEQGKNKIPITLFEASEKCDSGDYYIKDRICLKGDELIDEIREKQAKKIIQMVENYLSLYPLKSTPQSGKPTYYRRRRPGDNRLDINKSIKSQFNKMRVADNERYPLYFHHKNREYILKIYSSKKVEDQK